MFKIYFKFYLPNLKDIQYLPLNNTTKAIKNKNKIYNKLKKYANYFKLGLKIK